MEIEKGSVFQQSILEDKETAGGDLFIRSAYTLTSPFFDPAA